MAETTLDVFNTDAYNVISMTEAVNKLPFIPSRLGAMGLFKQSGITTTTAWMEEKDGHLALLKTAERGAAGTTAGRPTRKSRPFEVPHIPHDDTVLAGDVQGVRAFDKANETEGVAGVINERLAEMRQNHETTLEFHRAKAIQGLLLDADSSVIFDFWREFGVTEQTVDFLLGTATTGMRGKCLDVLTAVETALGGTPYDHVHAMCGKTWFKAFIDHARVRDTYQNMRDAPMLRDDPRAGFEFGGIIFEVYRGSVSGQAFVPDTVARFFPVGAPGLFRTHFSPGNFIEAVNTMGKPIYAKQERMKWNAGIEIHTESNPFTICTRPYCLVKGTTSN